MKLLNLLLKGLLISLLSVSASDGRFPVLKSLSGLLVLHWVLEVSVGSILVNDGILQVLLLLIG